MKNTSSAIAQFRRLCAVISTVMLAFVAQHASAQSVGFNFINSTNDVLAPTDVAGVYPYAQDDWNDLNGGNSGTFTVTNSLGMTNDFVMDWTSGFTDSTGAGGDLGTPDGTLMDGFMSSWGPGAATPLPANFFSQSYATENDAPCIYIRNLNNWWTNAVGAECYGVVLYTTGYSYWETAQGYIESAGGDPLSNTLVEGSILTPQYYEVDNSIFQGTYIQATGTSSSSQTFGANYMFFTGLTNDAILIRLQCSGYGAGINGFQLVPMYPSAPTNATATISPNSTVYAVTPVTLAASVTGDAIHTNLWYQWESDNGSGGLANNNILNATNATYTFTPTNSTSTYNLQFQVVVTNIFGATTSSVVVLTVNPAVAPFVTSDTTPGPGNSSGTVYEYQNGNIALNATFGGSVPISYQWQADTAGSYTNIPGAIGTTLTLSDLQPVSSGNYELDATNFIGSTNSTPATLDVLPDPAAPNSSVAYPYAVSTNNPVAYWRFSETLNNAVDSVPAYDYSGHNFNGTYGIQVYDDQSGPTYPGFESTNICPGFYNNVYDSWITVPSLNLNTNTVTITAWINPSSAVGSGWGLLTWRGTNGDAAGLNFGSSVVNGAAELGYIWNSNSPSTYNFNSALYPPLGQWSFVALTITPTNSTLYLYYLNGSTPVLSKAVQSITNRAESFNGGAIYIGSDPNNATGDAFNGNIDEVAVFGQSLSEPQIQKLYLTGVGLGGVAPTLQSEPFNFNNWQASNIVLSAISTFVGQPVVLSASGEGYPTPGYQWQGGTGGVFHNLSNNGHFSGVNSGTLTIASAALSDAMNYQLVLTNSFNSATSSVVSLSITPVPLNGLWTVNFVPIVTANNAPGALYSGHGVLGNGTFWNGLSGGNWANSTSYDDDGVTPSGINFSSTNYPGSWFSGNPMNNSLLDPYVDEYSGSGSTPSGFVFTNVPNGTYNLAVFGMSGSILGNQGATHVGTTFSVNGISESLTNIQDVMFAEGDNTALFTGLTVTNGSLNFAVIPNPYPGTEWDFNGAQLQAVSINPVKITTALSGSSLTLNWANYGTLLSATNVLGPWTPVSGATSPYVISATNAAQFFLVKIH